MMSRNFAEQERASLQITLDAAKTQAERNKLGQFATPGTLAEEIVSFGLALLGDEHPVRFLDPAFGTGSFFSALLSSLPWNRIEQAKGFEIDYHYGRPARQLWQDTALILDLEDFTHATPPAEEEDRYNLLICNPPYVRHHHILNGEKTRLQDLTTSTFGRRISGLAGLYCYFLGLAHAWMQKGGIAGWLVPSEFMDVNYGAALKSYLLERVTLLRIHRFEPNDLQFGDAIVSSAVVWFKNTPPPTGHQVDFAYGGSLSAPGLIRSVPASALAKEAKWTRFPIADVRGHETRHRLTDLFTIKRGIATGANSFFILTEQQVAAHGLPSEVVQPILPSPRYLPNDEIEADEAGLPLLEHRLFHLNCSLPEIQVQAQFPRLWRYLVSGKPEISQRYLCKSRKVWYFQEQRPPAPILCTYLGRGDTKTGRPFRFILNHSRAVAANVYLLLYPKPVLARALAKEPALLRRIWQVLNSLPPQAMLGEGRVYGGGLHKLEPRELGNVDAAAIVALAPDLPSI